MKYVAKESTVNRQHRNWGSLHSPALIMCQYLKPQGIFKVRFSRQPDYMSRNKHAWTAECMTTFYYVWALFFHTTKNFIAPEPNLVVTVPLPNEPYRTVNLKHQPCSGSVTFWYRSRSLDPYTVIRIQVLVFLSEDFKMPTKISLFTDFFGYFLL
jgi:hypothetical protein